MDIKEYSYILQIAQSGSISEAARKLHIAQPSLSIYLRSLEDRLGVRLFYKVKNRLALTAAGQRYVDYAQRIVTLDTALEREIKEIKSIARGEVVIGVTATRGMKLLELVLPEFTARYPNIKVTIREGHSSALEEMLHSHEIDIAVLNHPFLSKGLEYSVLSTEHIILIVPAHLSVNDHAVYEEGENLPWIDIAHFANEPFILLHKEQRMRQIIDRVFEQAGISPPVRWELSNATTAYRLCVAGLGSTVVADTFFTPAVDPAVKAYRIGSPAVTNSVVVAYHQEEYLSHAANAMLQVIVELYPRK